jgi:hypothetical protein
MSDRKIVTTHITPPIPQSCGCDWQATFDDYDLGDPIGIGATEQEAIDDLMMDAELSD